MSCFAALIPFTSHVVDHWLPPVAGAVRAFTKAYQYAIVSSLLATPVGSEHP